MSRLISARGCASLLKRDAVVIIDATWYLPNSPFAAPEGLASAKEAHEKERLPSSVYVDLDSISDETFSPAGHNLPTEETMKSLMGELGVRSKTDPVVVYDSIGMFSSPRMLYTLEAFGHENCKVLNGGLPAWKAEGLETVSGAASPAGSGERDVAEWPTLQPSLQVSLPGMKEITTAGRATIVDVRPKPRFAGEVAEPRPGLRSGHIAGSLNLPFLDLLGEDGKMKAEEDLKKCFREAGIAVPRATVFSCGSGMTAAIGRLAMLEIGANNEELAIYDGSWVEWGDEKRAGECPVEK